MRNRRWSSAIAALDANLLVALDALLQEANVTEAAKRIGITQSAMSQTLSRLRLQFDDPILVKVGRNMEPSPFALRIRERLSRAMAELEALVDERPAFVEATASTRFVVAMVDYLAHVLVPPLVRELARRAPSTSLAVHALDASSIAPSLQAGTVDLYVGVEGASERALETQSLFSERMRVLVRSAHPLAVGEMTALEYAAAPHVLVSPRREEGSIVTRALAEAGYERRLALEVPYFSLLPSLLEDSDLVATVPEHLAEHLADQHELTILEPPVTLQEIAICMAWHPTFGSDPAQLWLRERMAEVCTAL